MRVATLTASDDTHRATLVFLAKIAHSRPFIAPLDIRTEAAVLLREHVPESVIDPLVLLYEEQRCRTA